MSNSEIEKAIVAVKQTLAKFNLDHIDILNVLTDRMIETLKAAENLSTAVAYMRVVDCFTIAAKEARAAAYLKKEALEDKRAAAKGPVETPVTAINSQLNGTSQRGVAHVQRTRVKPDKKFAAFQRRQRLIAERSAAKKREDVRHEG